MGKIWMPGGGGGADLDVVTAGAGDVLSGKVIVDKDGNPLPGTMPNRGAISQALGINGTYTIPAGYHNGSGKVTQSIATMGAQTINPSASKQTVSSSGKYMTGDVTVNGVSNLTAANIKKGVNVGGTVGAWEGFVASSVDLYYRGNNVSGFSAQSIGGGSGTAVFEAGQISITGYLVCIAPNQNLNFVGRNYLNLQGYCTNGNTGDLFYLCETSNTTKLAAWNGTVGRNVDYTISINISALQISRILRLFFSSLNGAIYRIWLS